jgi:hypothetical protein
MTTTTNPINSVTVTLIKPEDGEKKHSVRFNGATQQDSDVLSSIYISKLFAPIRTARKIRVTVEVVE